MNDLAGVPLPLILVVSVALILAASEVGHRLGTSTGDRVGNNLFTLEAAILGLLALMISFTFAMALSRFDARREAVLNEANAIGTTALRARLLPAPHNSQCLTLEAGTRAPTPGSRWSGRRASATRRNFDNRLDCIRSNDRCCCVAHPHGPNAIVPKRLHAGNKRSLGDGWRYALARHRMVQRIQGSTLIAICGYPATSALGGSGAD